MMPRMRQALVEFENVDDAISCVQMCQVGPFPFMRHRYFVIFLLHLSPIRYISWTGLSSSIFQPAKKLLGISITLLFGVYSVFSLFALLKTTFFYFIVLYPFLCRSPYGISPNNTAPVAMPLDGNHEGSNHILLCTVFNPMYPITVVSEGGWDAAASRIK